MAAGPPGTVGLAGLLLAPVAPHDPAQLRDPRRSGGGHQQGACDRGQQEGHGQREAQVSAEEADVHGVRVLDDEDHHYGEDGDTRDEPGAQATGPRVHSYADAGRFLRLRWCLGCLRHLWFLWFLGNRRGRRGFCCSWRLRCLWVGTVG